MSLLSRSPIFLSGLFLLAITACSDKNPIEPDPTSSSDEPSSSSDSLSSSSEIPLSSSLADTISTDSSLSIENFEDGDGTNFLDGSWYDFSDNAGGGESSIDPEDFMDGFLSDGLGAEGLGYFYINFTLLKADYAYAPYYAFGTKIPYDSTNSPAKFAGISYWHKGKAHWLRVETSEVTNWDYYKFKVPYHANWTLVKIPFEDLEQAGWAGADPVDLNLDQDISIVWNIEGSQTSPNPQSGFLGLDDIRFEREIVFPLEYNMEILAPEIPDSLDNPGEVVSDLNTLSKTYLTKGMNFTNWLENAEKLDSSLEPSQWKFNEASVKLQADQKMKGIRLPVDLDLYIIERDSVLNGLKNEVELENILYTVLDSFNVWTKRHGLSLTIDYHQYDGSFTNTTVADSVYRQTVASVWKKIASHFIGETRADLFYELTNEPGLESPTKINQAQWTSLAQMMIDSIRTVDSNRPIIFGDTDWYSLDKLVSNPDLPFSDTKIIYSFHMYDPFLFTHQGASWTDQGSLKNIPFPYSEADWSTEYRYFGAQNAPYGVQSSLKEYYKVGNKTYIKNRLIKAKQWAYDHQVPLICNEWGAYSKSAQLRHLLNYFQTMGEIFTELDISWQVWFGIFDDNWVLLPGMDKSLNL